MTKNAGFDHPLTTRYASPEMVENFSSQKKFSTWRRLWIALAEAERRAGLPVTQTQIAEMKRHAEEINWKAAERYERRLKHDVMAHIRAYADQCPKAASIIHLGATSAYVVDNTDLIVIRDGLAIIRKKLANVMDALAKFALTHADLPTNAFTHFQPAQLTTVGKRASLWLQDIVIDFDELDHRMASLAFLGVKGAVGTQASFMNLLGNDEAKVKKLDIVVAKMMGFDKLFTISGQTYTRKLDSLVMSLLASIAESAAKFSNDMRLLQHLGEIQEPFGEEQVGSSAMPYKRNPMKAERIASLARFAIVLQQNGALTAASQWFERTLDDSAGKRIVLPEAFMACDAILALYLEIVRGAKVNADVIGRHVNENIPFIASETIMMEAVKRGGNRQELHERIRRHAVAVAEKMKSGGENDLIPRLRSDEAFRTIRGDLEKITRPRNFIGRAVSQTKEYVKREVSPRLSRVRSLIGMNVSSRV